MINNIILLCMKSSFLKHLVNLCLVRKTEGAKFVNAPKKEERSRHIGSASLAINFA